MAIGDLTRVPVAGDADLHCLDTGMYGVEAYGSVYVLRAERPAVIDTGIGADYDRVRAALAALDVGRDDLAAIVPTHVHLDHAGGAGFLARDYPTATVYVHEIGAPHLADPGRLVAGTKRAVGDQWRHYADPRPVPGDRLHPVAEGDAIDLGDRQLDVHGAPGHAPHQMVLADPDARVVFTADAAGIYVPAADALRPSTPPPDFDLEGCVRDLRTIRDLTPDVLCFGHFGPVEAAGVPGEAERVLRSWVAAVAAARERLRDDEAVVAHFIEEAPLAAVWGEEHARAQAELNARGALRYLARRGN